ncbi:hypothetical protein ANCCEY_12855 [Ancylostoma ceylanicum]|uniref:Cilia- and flagella-associated protein 36 n=1 Tax=Ancylostoma ceylanicum TaxID=53326 RepID=A0A0D6LA63_9BILA|nr:hypothetical protein ANCCEY_12855 [Ancylostoma ceylanicum]
MLRRLSRKGSSDTKNVLGKFFDFIESPIWALPVATFIEHRSVVFDRQQGDASLYENIHKEFRELVDTLVECFCADSNVAVERLREELKSTKAEKLTVRQKNCPYASGLVVSRDDRCTRETLLGKKIRAGLKLL